MTDASKSAAGGSAKCEINDDPKGKKLTESDGPCGETAVGYTDHTGDAPYNVCKDHKKALEAKGQHVSGSLKPA